MSVIIAHIKLIIKSHVLQYDVKITHINFLNNYDPGMNRGMLTQIKQFFDARLDVIDSYTHNTIWETILISSCSRYLIVYDCRAQVQTFVSSFYVKLQHSPKNNMVYIIIVNTALVQYKYNGTFDLKLLNIVFTTNRESQWGPQNKCKCK